MHILFLTDNFPPETNAPASRTYEHATRWVAAGHHVTVVTGAPNFPSGKVHAGYRNRICAHETIDGIDVVRIWTYITANEGFLRRTLDYMSFMVSAILVGPLLRRPDVIVATSPQFFTPCAGWVISLFRSCPFVFELRDLWPDSIVAVGAMRETRIILWLRRLEYFLYRRATAIVSLTHSFRRVLVSNGIDPGKIPVIPNGVDLATYVPGSKPDGLVRGLGLNGKFVAAYIGTVGMAHGIGTLLDSARILKHRADIAFVVVGTGADHAAQREKAEREGLSNVVFVGAVSKTDVKDYWRLCDAAVVLLKDAPLFRHVIPSKIFEAMGMARPIILGVQGESADIVREAAAGVTIRPEDPAELACALENMADNEHFCVSLGLNGRRYVSERFSREKLALAMLDELERVVVSATQKSVYEHHN